MRRGQHLLVGEAVIGVDIPVVHLVKRDGRTVWFYCGEGINKQIVYTAQRAPTCLPCVANRGR